MHTRILVADQTEAIFYDMESAHAPLQFRSRLSDPLGHLHDRDLKSDRPGRVFDSAAATSGRRGAVGHHSTGGERTPRKHEAAHFAHQIVEELERARRAGEFDRVVLMAAPTFLGLLRAALPESLHPTVVAEVGKNLTQQPASVVREHVPQQAFAMPSSSQGEL